MVIRNSTIKRNLLKFLREHRDKSDYEAEGFDEDEWDRGYDDCLDLLKEFLEDIE